MIALALLASLVATDGDTVRLGAERIRLAGIDAPELHRCPRHRTCVPGDGRASKAALERLLRSGPVRIERVGVDRYGRTLARLYVNGRSIGCEMVRIGAAVERWGRC